MVDSQFTIAEKKLWSYLKSVDFQGWDPFDGLNSRLFQRTPFKHSRIVRLVWLQLFKRSPLNLRELARIPKGINPKGHALLASASLLRGDLQLADSFLEQLQKMACQGWEYPCWGYNFDWQARAFYVPRGTPNMVTSVFVANAFMDRFDRTRLEADLAVAHGVCRFILRWLILHEDEETACLGYIPGEGARIHNANMLGAALLGRVTQHVDDERMLTISRKSMAYSMRALKSDGSWPYGERGHHGFVDNFHTAYNLVCLHDWMNSTGERQWEKELQVAAEYYCRNFWLADGSPKYYNNSLYPIDSHCSAMGLVACAKLPELVDSDGLSKRIATWAIQHLQRENGAFLYQMHRWFSNVTPYMRWTQCWMAYGLAHLSHGSREDSSV